MEAQFTAHNLGLTWEEFGDLDRSDLDAVILEKGLNAVNRGKVVSLWKRHPNKLTGEFYSIAMMRFLFSFR